MGVCECWMMGQTLTSAIGEGHDLAPGLSALQAWGWAVSLHASVQHRAHRAGPDWQHRIHANGMQSSCIRQIHGLGGSLQPSCPEDMGARPLL